jgi:tRNA threonylcarbamoyl adenosine modification protein (Sua5/YciO/YrdC/YwlC family)
VRTIAVRSNDPHKKVVREAVRVLLEGGIVAFPTETVYGLVVDATNKAACDRLYALKGRGAEKACAFLLPDRDAAGQHVPRIPAPAARIADAFWPGPVTLVLPGQDGTLVGLRLPSEALPRALAREVGRPLLQTSANKSGQPAAINAAGVAAALGSGLDLILDSGRSPGGRASTVVQCDAHTFKILRAGAVPAAELTRAATDLYLSICTGNICRSPLAEALFRREAAQRLDCDQDDVVSYGYRFGSCGTSGLPGHPASDHSIRVGKELGVDLSAHRGRPMSESVIAEAHAVYCLARHHQDELIVEFPSRVRDCQILRPDGQDIPDPIGRSLKTYRLVAKQIEAAVQNRIEEILSGDLQPSDT